MIFADVKHYVYLLAVAPPSLISLMVSMDAKHYERKKEAEAPVLRRCVKVEVAVWAARP